MKHGGQGKIDAPILSGEKICALVRKEPELIHEIFKRWRIKHSSEKYMFKEENSMDGTENGY